MKKLTETLICTTLILALALTSFGCGMGEVSSDISSENYSAIGENSSPEKALEIYESITLEEIKEAENNFERFTDKDRYEEVLDLYAYPVGVSLSWSKVEEMPVEKLLRFYFINAFAVDAKDITTQNPDMTYGTVFYMPSEYVEGYITTYFNVESDFLRTSKAYDKSLNAYGFNDEGGRGGYYDYTLLNAEEYESSIIKLYIKYTTNYENTSETAYAVLVIQKSDEDRFKYLCVKNFDCEGKFIGSISDPTLKAECEMILSNFSENMLLHSSFESTEEIGIGNLVAWYGYRVKAQEKADDYRSENIEGLLFPAEEFEDAMYRFFGIEKEHLRTSKLYNREYQGYITNGSLYLLADNNYHLTKADVSGNTYKIYFDFTVADHILEFCVLTAEKDGENIRFISYSRQERLPELN